MQKHLILGAGAMGHLIASMLTLNGSSATLITRAKCSHQKDTFVSGENGQIPVSIPVISLPEVQDVEILWLAVKSYQLEVALESIKSNLRRHSWLILLQNGMGNLETATKCVQGHMPTDQIIAVANTHGAYLEITNQSTLINHTGKGQLQMGPNYLNKDEMDAPDFIQYLPATMDICWCSDIASTLWLKLAINAVINPITAWYQCRNGDILSRPECHSEAELLIGELKTFFNRTGRAELADTLQAACHQVITKTADNYSSMMLDVKNGRQTEIEAISGYLLNQANSVRLAMTEHQKQYHRLLNT